MLLVQQLAVEVAVSLRRLQRHCLCRPSGRVRLLLMLLPLPLLLLPGLRQQTLHFGHPLCMQQPAGRHNLLRQLLQVAIPGQAKLDAAGSRHRVVDVTAVLSVATAACRPAARGRPLTA